MEKLDRLGWAAGIAFTAYGVSVGVRVSDPSLLEPVRALLPPGWKPAEKRTVRRLYSLIVGGPTSRPGVRRFNVLYSDAARLVRTQDLEETLAQLELELEQYIADRAPRRTFAVGLDDTIAWYRANEPWWRRVKSGEYRRFYDLWYGERLN